jgi:hypothetical protein
VNRRVDGEQQMRYVAQTHLEFDRTFTDIILNPNQLERSRKLKRVTKNTFLKTSEMILLYMFLYLCYYCT